MSSSSVSEFYKDHVSVNQYCFQIKKCLNKNCKYHKPVWMDIEEFKKMIWLPMPTIRPNSGVEEKYRAFEEAVKIDEMPTDRDRPGASANIEERNNIPRPEWKYTKQRARKIIFCKECAKPRLLHALKALDDR